MSKCGAAHIRLVIIWRKVGDLRHLVREGGEIGETVGPSHLVLTLEGEVRHQRNHVGVPCAFTVAVDRGLDVAYACVNRRERVRHGELCVVMRVNPPDHVASPLVRCECGACSANDLAHPVG